LLDEIDALQVTGRVTGQEWERCRASKLLEEIDALQVTGDLLGELLLIGEIPGKGGRDTEQVSCLLR
jgi:hypothetical protein